MCSYINVCKNVCIHVYMCTCIHIHIINENLPFIARSIWYIMLKCALEVL